MTSAVSRVTSPRSCLLESLSREMRLRHYSDATVRSYLRWVVRYVRYHGTRHPSQLDRDKVVEFLSALAIRGGVSASTQNQAMAAIGFMYREVLGTPLEELEPIARAKRPVRIPVVLTPDEVHQVIGAMDGIPQIVAMLLYGSGLRVLECLELRVKDVDFAGREIVVRGGKGDKDRLTMLPGAVDSRLREHLERVRLLHAKDLRRGGGRVDTPNALARKYPSASTEWRWQYVFPATRTYVDVVSRELRRHHLHVTMIQRAVATAVRAAGLTKRATCHFQAFVRDAPDRERLRHPDGAGAIGSHGRSDDDDLYPRSERRRSRRSESHRCTFALKGASEDYVANLAAYRRSIL